MAFQVGPFQTNFQQEDEVRGRAFRRGKKPIWPSLDELRNDVTRAEQEARDVAQKIAALQDELPTAKIKAQAARLQARLDALERQIEEAQEVEMVMLLAYLDD